MLGYNLISNYLDEDEMKNFDNSIKFMIKESEYSDKIEDLEAAISNVAKIFGY